MESYVFFIGGTGARVLRSFLHLCASGAVRINERINAVMLDVDSENSACHDARVLYDIYRQSRKKLLEVQDAFGYKIPAFCANVEMPAGGTAVINPIRTNARAILDLAAGNSRRALDWFYTAQERSQSLEHGFFAHPNVGCLFFDGVQFALEPYTDSIVSALNAGNDVRVVIVGSMFGGTGAAGIPLIQRMIYDNCAQKASPRGNLRLLHFGGVLVTPYFKFKDPDGKTDNLHIHHNLFFGNTRSALEYYNWNYLKKPDQPDQEEGGAFERIYLAGQDTLQFVSQNGEYSDGGARQNNKPHIVELIAAMGIRDFLLNTDPSDKSANIYEKILRSNAPEGERLFGWNTLDGLESLADMLRTQALMRTVIAPIVEKKLSERWPWFGAFHMDRPDIRPEMDAWMQYGNRFILWMYNLQYQWDNTNATIWERDERISLAGRSIENVWVQNFDIGRQFSGLIENRTGAVNVNYSYIDGRRLLIDLGAQATIEKRIGDLGVRGLFTQLFQLASRR